MENEYHTNKILENGYSSIKGTISDNEINYLKKYVGARHIDKLSRKEKVFFDIKNSYFQNLKYFFINQKIKKIINRLNLKKIASDPQLFGL